MKVRHEALKAQLRREEAKVQSRVRANDTRRKVLIGAMMQGRVESDAALRAELRTWMDKFLVRGNDRALFDFPALPGHPVEAEATSGETAGDPAPPSEIKAA